MTITVQDIEALTFNEAKKGYDPVEVNIALDNIAVEVEAFIETIAKLESELKSAQTDLAKALKNGGATKSGSKTASSNNLSADEEAISRAFVAAQRSADELKRTAASQADDILAEANGKAEQVIAEANDRVKQIENDLATLNEKRVEFQKEFLNMLESYRKVASQNSQLDKAVAKQSGKVDASADEAVSAAVAAEGSAILADSQALDSTASLEQIEDDDL